MISAYMQEPLRKSLPRFYLATALCFLVINITNKTILQALNQHGLIYGRDLNLSINFEKTSRFLLVPLKSLVFFICTAFLLSLLGMPLVKRVHAILLRKGIARSLVSFFLCFALTANLFPIAFGRAYARISTDPFNQDADQLYRRLLIPGLAHLYHVEGFLYILFFWLLVFVTILVLKLYFFEHGVELSLLQELSLLTVGAFVSAYQSPGYPEIVVVLLGLIALIEFEKNASFSLVQLAAFSLALMAHEACAVIVFVPMILFLFGQEAWIPSGIVALMYGVTLLANFSFNIFVPLGIQTTISSMSAEEIFRRWPLNVLLGAAFTFKVFWLLLPIGLYYQLRNDRRYAYVVLCGFTLALASCYLGIDYSRLIGFATIPMVMCFLQVRTHMPPRALRYLTAANLIAPSFLVAGSSGVVTCKGLYYLAYSAIFKLHVPAS